MSSPDLGTFSSGVVHCVTRENSHSLPTTIITDLTQVGIFKTSVKVKNCVSPAPLLQQLALQSATQASTQSLPQLAALPLAQPIARPASQLPALVSAHSTVLPPVQPPFSSASVQEAMPIQPIKDLFFFFFYHPFKAKRPTY